MRDSAQWPREGPDFEVLPWAGRPKRNKPGLER